MRTLVIAAIVVVSGCSKPFGPGFEGEITMHTQQPGQAGMDMVVKTKGDKLRFDMKTAEGDTYSVRDPSTGNFATVMDSSKSYMEMDFSKPSARPSTNPDTSTVTKGGKHETIAGVDCEDWTATDATGKKSEVCVAQGVYVDFVSGKTAVAKDLKEKSYFPLRNVDYDAKGNELSRTEVTKIEKKKLDDSLFTVPAGYTKVATPTTITK